VDVDSDPLEDISSVPRDNGSSNNILSNKDPNFAQQFTKQPEPVAEQYSPPTRQSSKHRVESRKETKEVDIENYKGSSKKENKNNQGFSLSAIANDKLQQYVRIYDERKLKPFAKSKILTENEAKILYFNIPFDLEFPPKTKLLYQSNNENPSDLNIQKLFSTRDGNHPNIILFKYKDNKFGGYASQPWVHQTPT